MITFWTTFLKWIEFRWKKVDFKLLYSIAKLQTNYLLVFRDGYIIQKIKTDIIKLTTKFVFIELKLHSARPIFKHYLFYVFKMFCNEIGVFLLYTTPIRSVLLKPRQQNIRTCWHLFYLRRKIFQGKTFLSTLQTQWNGARRRLRTIRMKKCVRDTQKNTQTTKIRSSIQANFG